MDTYPSDYVAANRPLYILSGLNVGESAQHKLQVNGPRIGSDTVQVGGTRAEQVVEAFARLGTIDHDFGSNGTVENLRISCHFARAQYTLPARKASPQATVVESPLDVHSPQSSNSRVLHSPLSPLAAGSPLYPDGLMTPQWNAKYQHIIPAVFISCFEIASDPNTDSLRDNQLKSEIASIRNTIEDSRYRTRYAAILIGDRSVVNGSELEERVINIRRAARLDEACLFFLDADTQQQDLIRFAVRVASALHPHAMDFYRDLTRHTRRKRDKGANTSHSISRLGWLARYEYKLGVFAEFRDETDVAARHYNTSMMAFFDSQGPFEFISSWSPRWTDARVWSDTTFVRLIRAQLASNAPTAAVRSWTRHRDRTRDILDRKGKGTENYGYLTWEARWSKVMAELTRCSPQLFEEPIDGGTKTDAIQPLRVYAQPDTNLAQDQQSSPVLIPWHFLHHAGYWLRQSIRCTKKRLDLAFEIPEEDRVSPGESPASTVARRNESYDTYMALEPHSEWQASQDRKGAQTLEIVGNLGRAAGEFQAHDQHRLADQFRLELCQQLMRAGQYNDAMQVLKALWKSARWRAEKWRVLLEPLLYALYHCAVELQDSTMQVASLWELCNSLITPRSDFQYDIAANLRSIATQEDSSKTFHLNNEVHLSCVYLSFSFSNDPVYVGVPISGQLVVSYDAHGACAALTLQQINVEFDNQIPAFTIVHAHAFDGDETNTGEYTLRDVNFDERREQKTMCIQGQSSLHFRAGQTKAFNVLLVPEETGRCQAVKGVSIVKEGNAIIEQSSSLLLDTGVQVMLLCDPAHPEQSPKTRKVAPRTSVNIQPRPPRIDVDFVGLRNIYYTDETISFELKLHNGEDEDASVELEVEAQSESSYLPVIRWSDTDISSGQSSDSKLHAGAESLPVGDNLSKQLVIAPSTSAVDMILEIRVSYTLSSSSSRKIRKLASADVVVIRPFEANYQVLPDYHAADWPSYFQMDETIPASDVDNESEKKDRTCTGISSQWKLQAKLTSFATDTLRLEAVRLQTVNVKIPTDIRIKDDTNAIEPIDLVSNGQYTKELTLKIQKHSMDEQRAVTATPTLHLNWRRLDAAADTIVSSILELPRLSLAGSEPRALARQLSTVDDRTVLIEYVIENPSIHLLTFSISIESSEEFAFSGPKSLTLHLTPMSRHGVSYLFTPFNRGAQIQPDVQITDTYFNKALSIMPTGSLRAENGELKASAIDGP